MARDDLSDPVAEHWAPDQDVLDRYLAGECSEPERARLATWLQRNPHCAAQLRAMERVAHWHAADVTQVDVEQLRARFWAEVHTAEERAGDTRVKRARPPMTGLGWWSAHRTWYVAASLVACAIVLTFGWSRLGRRKAAVPPAIYATANGQRANITLSDGTTIALNVASRLAVAADYAAGNHTVYLASGAALFTVLHHDNKPFTVVAAGTVTRVLGTSFAVRRYDTDTATIVVVRDGKVAVGTTVVPAARMVTVGPHGTSTVRPADPAQFEFAAGVLTLPRTRLADAIPELDRWYNADIRLGDPALASRIIEGDFAAGSLSDLTEVFRLTFDVRVVRDGRVLTLLQPR